MGLWRKLTVLLSAVAMAFVLTACGGPSEEKAADFGLEITKALFAGNTKPMLDNMDYGNANATQKEAMRNMAEGKLKDLMSIQQAMVAQRGGVDTIEVSKVEFNQNTNIYQVFFLVTYNNGENQTTNMNLRWSEDKDNFIIVNK